LHINYFLVSRHIFVTIKRSAQTMQKEEIKVRQECPVEMTIKVIGGRWKCPIIHHLLSGTKRFNELRKLIPAASQRMLTKHLRELEEHGIVHRKVFAEVPPKTEYSLTDVGRSLEPVMWAMHDWAVKNLDFVAVHQGETSIKNIGQSGCRAAS